MLFGCYDVNLLKCLTGIGEKNYPFFETSLFCIHSNISLAKTSFNVVEKLKKKGHFLYVLLVSSYDRNKKI